MSDFWLFILTLVVGYLLFIRRPGASVVALAELQAQLARLEEQVELLRTQLLQMRRQRSSAEYVGPSTQAAQVEPSPPDATSLLPSAPTLPLDVVDAATPPPTLAPTPPERAAALEATPVASEAVSPADTMLSLDWAAPADDNVDAPVASAPPIAPPPAPPTESVFDRLWGAARDWLLGGNAVVRIGMLVLFFGVGFLLKYAADNALLPVEVRLTGVAVGAIAMLVFGWRLPAARRAYALVLQGGGVGVLYLTIFAAVKLYHLLPAGLALPLLIAMGAFSAFLAIRQDASSLAVMGITGGFLAPVLLSTGGGSHIALFSYYALLNLGIVGIAWHKAWRQLNLLGFLFTFGIGLAWGAELYRPVLLATTEPFLVLFFLLYVAITVLFAQRQAPRLKHYIDGTLLFGTPVVAFGMQAKLLAGSPFALALSAVAVAGLYLGLASALVRRQRRALGLLVEAFLSLGVIFATLAIPLALGHHATAATWAVEGAGIAWISLRQRRALGLSFALLLQVAAGIAFLLGNATSTGWPLLNSAYLGCVLLALAGLFSARKMRQHADWAPALRVLEALFALWGLLWWAEGGLAEIDRLLQPAYWTTAWLLFAALTAVLASEVRRRLDWPLARVAVLGFLPVLWLIGLEQARWVLTPDFVFDLLGEHIDTMAIHPFVHFGFVAWPVALAVHYGLLRRHDDDAPPSLLAPLHALSLLGVGLLLAWELHWWVLGYVPEGAWSQAVWPAVFGGLLLFMAQRGWRIVWPVQRYPRAYLVAGALPAVLFLGVWSVVSAVVSDGSAAPLPYIPVLNPLDIAQILGFLAIWAWWRRTTGMGLLVPQQWMVYTALLLGFGWFNADLLRMAHNWFHFAYDLGEVAGHLVLQEAFLVGWGLFALLGLVVWRGSAIARLLAIASAPIVALMWLWTFYANLMEDGGRFAGIPLFNPLDLCQLLVFGVIAVWLVRVAALRGERGLPKQAIAWGTGVTAFVWLNAVLLRALHYWAHIPYALDALTQSTLVQAALSLFWTVLALGIMVSATRRASRTLWFVGGALLIVVVIKLFTVDLSHIAGMQRIVSFIGVGILLLLIGYFSPLPPAKTDALPENGS